MQSFASEQDVAWLARTFGFQHSRSSSFRVRQILEYSHSPSARGFSFRAGGPISGFTQPFGNHSTWASIVNRLTHELGLSSRTLIIGDAPVQSLCRLNGEVVHLSDHVHALQLGRLTVEARQSRLLSVAAPAEALPFSASSFDHVVLAQPLRRHRMPSQWLRRVRDLLRRPGRMTIVPSYQSNQLYRFTPAEESPRRCEALAAAGIIT
jgi:hypothetical protein